MRRIFNFSFIKDYKAIEIMEEQTKKNHLENDKEIIFSKAIKAGKRIYYLDVKKSRKNEMYLAITESKKIISEEGNDSQVSFEKHKIFLYKEDFEKFANGLQQAIQYIKENSPEEYTKDGRNFVTNREETPLKTDEIKIDIDF